MSRQQSGGERGFPWLGQVLSLLTLIAASALAGALAASRHAAWPWVVTLAACAASVAWLRVWSARFDPMKNPMTDSKRAEESGRASSDYERLSRTIAAAGIGTWDWDLMANELAWSDNLEQVLGVEERLERSLEGFLTIVAAEDHALIREAIEKSLQDPSRGVLVPHEFRVGPEPPYRWIEGNGRLFRDDEGRPVRMMGTIMDVTRRRLADDEVRRASAAKSTFVTSMSHEMRTPLNGVIGMIELLGQTRVSEQQRGFLDTLSKSAESLLALVNDVLDISKVEAGALELEEISFDARRLARDAVGVVAQQAERKGLALSCRLDPGLPAAVLGDPGRLRQVLLNLLSNAVKFTPSGAVTLRVLQIEDCRLQNEKTGEAKATSSSSNLQSAICDLQFEVSDTGVGIPADKLATIFEPFAQGDVSTARTHGGTGLGLTIASRLVERMGGRLTVVSQPGQGSTFSFAVPLKAAAPAEPPPAPAAPAEAVARVLLAEDNTVNQQVLTLLLEKAGYRVEVAGNGREALSMLERERFDLVLMDVQMPEMDGLRATRLIRQREKAVGGHVPIVAVTANAVQGERQRCLSAGMDDYLSKPVRGAELFATMARLLGSKAQVDEAASPAAGQLAWVAPLAAMGFDPDAVAKLARTFLETVPPRLTALRQAVQDGQAEQVRLTAHSLKGSLAVFAAQEAIDTAWRLEQAGRERRLDGAERLLNDLSARLDTLFASMRGYFGG